MRILHVLQKPHRRGAEISAADVSAQLRARGHEVSSVYLYAYEGDKPLPLLPGDVVLGGREPHPFERIFGGHPALLKALVEQIERFHPDIVQVNGSRSVKYGALSKALRRSQQWCLVYRNIDDPKFWNTSRLKVLAYRSLVMSWMDGVLGVSRRSLANAIEMYGLNVPSQYIPRSINPAALRLTRSRDEVRMEWGVGPDDLVVAFVGGLVPQKRPDRFLRVMEQVCAARPTVWGWMLGDGPLRRDVERQREQMTARDRIRILGYRNDVADVLHAADLLALTSDTEGTPGVVLEAAYLEVPAVATAVGGVPECILDGVTGHTVTPGDEAGLVEALLALTAPGAGAARRQLGTRARALVLDEFTIASAAEKYETFYRRLLEQS